MSASSTISPALRWYRKTALLNTEAGLTCKGGQRRRRLNARNQSQRVAMRRDRGLQAWNDRVMRLRAQGLTTRGTPRIYAVRRGDALLLKAQLDGLATALAKIFPRLPAAVRAQALELERSLSSVRKQIV